MVSLNKNNYLAGILLSEDFPLHKLINIVNGKDIALLVLNFEYEEGI
jgi:hypothetical protein